MLVRDICPDTVILLELTESEELRKQRQTRATGHSCAVRCSPGGFALSFQVYVVQGHWKACSRMSRRCLLDSQRSTVHSGSPTLWYPINRDGAYPKVKM